MDLKGSGIAVLLVFAAFMILMGNSLKDWVISLAGFLGIFAFLALILGFGLAAGKLVLHG